MAANARQERETIAALVGANWHTAPYGLVGGGLTSITCNPITSSWRPRNSLCVLGRCVNFNVCWTFTCAYAAYLYQVNGVRPRAIGAEMSVRDAADIPSAWTCKPEQYGTGDGCQCSCGAFDPDCNPVAAVPVDCPNRDDICIPGPLNEPVCMLRHEVLSDRKAIQVESGVPVHHPQFYFTNDTDVDGAPWGNYSSTYTRSDVPATWTCNPLFYGSKDGCDCQCGAWDPDCDANAGPQKVFNCDTNNREVRCAMSKTAQPQPVCLFDRMAASAALEAGFTTPSEAAPAVSISAIVAASVCSTLVAVAVAAAITHYIRRRQRAPRKQESMHLSLLRRVDVSGEGAPVVAVAVA